jgi:hypothetical protein
MLCKEVEENNMVYLDTGRSGLNLAYTGSMQVPDVISVGDTSGAISVATTGLRGVFDSQALSSVVHNDKTSTFTADFGASALSGNSVLQFGVETSGTGVANTTWNAEQLVTSLDFDGTSELQIQIEFQNY